MMSSLVMRLKFAILAWVLLNSVSALADVQTDAIKADMHDVVRVLKETSTNSAERDTLDSITFIVPNTLTFNHVGALKLDNGARAISFNVGSYLRFNELADAIFLTMTGIGSEQYLLGYVRYLGYAELFGDKFLSARDYASRSGIADVERRISAWSISTRQSFEIMRASILYFITAHEVAHHLFRDPDNATTDLAERRAREERADKWATEAVLRAGLNPALAVFSLLVFNEMEGRVGDAPTASSHPASLSRAIRLLEGVAAYLNENEIAIAGALSLAKVPYTVAALRNANAGLLIMVRERLLSQNSLKSNAAYLMQRAGQGDRFAQIKLGNQYLTGSDPAFPHSAQHSIYWFQRAAEKSSGFDYVDIAIANYEAGFVLALNTEIINDLPKACSYLERASAMSYMPAVIAYKKLSNEGKCNESEYSQP